MVEERQRLSTPGADSVIGALGDAGGTWAQIEDWLRGFKDNPPAQASADLLAAAATRWEPVLRAHTSLTNLVFSRPGESYPWSEAVWVSYKDGIFEFRLQGAAGGPAKTGRCPPEDAAAFLDDFLMQLGRGSDPAPAPVDCGAS